MFTESGGLGGGAPFCLANAPVLFHLQVVNYNEEEEDYGNQNDEDEDGEDEKKDDHNLLSIMIFFFFRMTRSCFNTSKMMMTITFLSCPRLI